MAGVTIPNLDYLHSWNIKLYESLRKIIGYLQPTDQPAPPPVRNVNVVSLGNGAVDVAFEDSGPVNHAISYFVEHADNPGFSNARIEHFGASRNGTVWVGSHARYWRAYSQYQYPFSQPNEPVSFAGGAVSGGGSATPALQASTGSGTAATSGQQPGSGFGKNRVRPS